jgi:hypothetical protein
MLKQVTEDEYLTFILKLAKPNTNGKPRKIPDAPNSVYRQGAKNIADYIIDGVVVARHSDQMNHGSTFYIQE